MSNLYEISFLCISKQECSEEERNYYKHNIMEIFQNERINFNFEIKTLILEEPKYKTIKSTIQLYRRISDFEMQIINKKNEQKKSTDQNKPVNNQQEAEREKEKEKEKKENEFNMRINFCYLNKEKLFSNITFCDNIGKFFEKSFYFIKYISNKVIESPLGSVGEAKIIDISRCGFNMEKILKEVGYKEKSTRQELGFCYQYKYYPIIGIYGIVEYNKNIFLQVKGYYNEKTKDEIVEKLNEIHKQLSELFLIK